MDSDDLLSVVADAARRIQEEPEFGRTVIMATDMIRLAASGYLTAEHARRILNSDGLTMMGGEANVNRAMDALRRIAANG